MAAIVKKKKGIQFYLNRELGIVRLNKHFNQAERIKLIVEEVINSIETGCKLSRSTQCFLDDMKPDLRDRFIKAGLIEPPKEITVGKLFDRFIREPIDPEGNVRKDSTILTYETASKRFFSFFGVDKMAHDVSHNDCLQWKKWLEKKGYEPTTVGNSLSRSTAVFNWAIKQGFVESNPFNGVTRPPKGNEANNRFIPMTDHYKILDACPNQEWRTLITLWRIGGLRASCEIKELRWVDIYWAKGLMKVTSPKTAHHNGKDSRLVPLFPELRIELFKLWEQAKEQGRKETDYVIERLRNHTNNGTQFARIVKEAGLQQWPRIIQNLRASRSTEIFNHPKITIPQAEAIMGQSYKVAKKHYLNEEEMLRSIASMATVPTGSGDIMFRFNAPTFEGH